MLRSMLQYLLPFLFPDDRERATGPLAMPPPVLLDREYLRRHGLLSLDRVVGAADYKTSPQLHGLIHRLKYRGVRGVATVLGEMMAGASQKVLPFSLPSPPAPLPQAGEGSASPVLCPVPLHWIRRFSRGFNQAELLAGEIARIRGWEVRPLLARRRWTGSQVGRTREERLGGVRGAFAVQNIRIGIGVPVPTQVILVDDVFTTGATLEACATVLKRSGVRTVGGLVAAVR